MTRIMLMLRRSSEPVVVLEYLLALTTDGVAGYRLAATRVGDRRVRAVLEDNAARREEIASVLAYALLDLGATPKSHGTLTGFVHRRWLDAVSRVARDDAAAILRTCARGERETIAGFSAALGRTLPEPVRAVVQSQLGRVLAASALVRRAMTQVVRGSDVARSPA